jgi:hypothetical protein
MYYVIFLSIIISRLDKIFFSSPTYTISISEITVGNSLTDLEFSTIFDTGTSFTYLADPAYTYITQSFHAQVHANRHAADSRIPFEYCYDLRFYSIQKYFSDLLICTLAILC